MKTSFTCSVDAEFKEAILQAAKDKRNERLASMFIHDFVLDYVQCSGQGRKVSLPFGLRESNHESKKYWRKHEKNRFFRENYVDGKYPDSRF